MSEAMRAVMKLRREPGLELSRWPVPEPNPEEVLVKVEAAAICGSDLHFYRWDEYAQSRIHPPLILGHEVSGTVVAVGDRVRGVKVGTRIAAESHIPCGVCPVCRGGNQHVCQNLKILGNEWHGGFAEYMAIPETIAVPIDPQLPPEVGAILEPLGGAVHAVLVEPVSGQTVLVYGDGPIGILSAAVAKASGAARVFLVGKHPLRMELARQMGADMVFTTDDIDGLRRAVLEETEGAGVDVAIEMSGSPRGFLEGLPLVRRGGRFTAFGVTARPIELDVNYAITLRQIRVLGVAGRHMWNTREQMQGLLRSGRLDPSPIITHRMPLEEFDRGFQLLTAGEKQVGKVVLFP